MLAGEAASRDQAGPHFVGSLSTVVVSFNTKALLRNCLLSLSHQPSRISQEVIVVDNASDDGSVDMVRAEFPEVRLASLAQNIGFSGATNVGLEMATGSVLLILNSDTEVRDGALDAMASALAADPRAAIAGCRLVGVDGRTQPSAGDLPGLRVQLFSFFELKRLVPYSVLRRLASWRLTRWLTHAALAGYSVPLDGSSKVRYVEFVSGACLMITRPALAQIGYLDERIFMYLEDADWCRRASACGWKLLYVPAGEVLHIGGQSFRATHPGQTYRISLERCRSLFTYFRKYNGTPGALALKLIVIPSMVARMVFARSREERELYRSIAGFALKA